MPDVNVTYDAMSSAAQKLTSGKEEITGQLTQLKSMVDGLVESEYVTDISSKSFHEAYTEFNTGVMQTIEGLDVMSKFLTDAVQRFTEADHTTVTG